MVYSEQHLPSILMYKRWGKERKGWRVGRNCSGTGSEGTWQKGEMRQRHKICVTNVQQITRILNLIYSSFIMRGDPS
jgi:hypothetical protein